jgi:hypothetical protein
LHINANAPEETMSTEPQTQDQKPEAQAQEELQALEEQSKPQEVDGLKDRKPEELTPEELRLMADTMPGEGPGD